MKQEIDYYEVIKEFPGGMEIGARHSTPFDGSIYPIIKSTSGIDPTKYPEFFKPVYKKQQVLFTLQCESGNFDVEIVGSGDDKKAKFDGKEWSYSLLKLLMPTYPMINGYTIRLNVSSVNIGCKIGVSLQSLDKLISILEPLPF